MDHKDAAALLGAWDHILILTHRRPDGDTIGSAVGLCALLRQLGKTAWLLPNREITDTLAPYTEGMLAPADFAWKRVVAVDVASLGLLTEEGRAIAQTQGVDLVIDHHPSNEGYGRHSCVEADKAACGEIIYALVEELGTLTPQVAAPLYVAVSTDTGCFAYSNTTAHTHKVAAALMALPISAGAINKRHFRTKSLKRLRLEGLLVERMALFDNGALAVTALSLADMAAVGATEEDAEDIAAVIGQIEGVRASATVRELKPGECKISLRSDPAYLDASATCALLGGGGHRAAAGCSVNGSVEEAREAIRQAAERARHG